MGGHRFYHTLEGFCGWFEAALGFPPLLATQYLSSVYKTDVLNKLGWLIEFLLVVLFLGGCVFSLGVVSRSLYVVVLLEVVVFFLVFVGTVFQGGS